MNTQKSISKESLSPGQVSPEKLLSNKQLVVVSALGVFFWFVFAMFVRFTSGMGIFGGLAGVATFLLSIPAAWLLVVIIRGLAGLSRNQIVPGLSMSTAAAGLCDGVAMTWTSLYGNDPRGSYLGAAFILWGVGVILVVAYVMAAVTPGRITESD